MTTAIAEKLVTETTELFEAGENLLARLNDGETLTPGEFAVFDRLGWDQRRIEKERARVAGVRRHQNNAGTTESRAQALAEAERVEAIAAKSAETIQSKIIELQSDLRDINAEATAARGRHNAMTQAVAALRSPNLLPEFVTKAHQRRVNAAVLPLEGNAHPIRQKLDRATHALTLNHHDHNAIHRDIRNARRFDETETTGPLPRPWYIERRSKNVDEAARKTRFVREAWLDYLEECRAAIPALEQQIAEEQARVVAAQAEVDSALDHYVPKT